MNKDIPVFIHNFSSKVLKEGIKSLGFKVTELNHNQRTHLKNDLYINILAADNCNPELCYRYFGCAPLETKFGSTSIDTLCVIDNGKEVVVNTNDCPYDLSLTSAQIIKNNYRNIDLLLVGFTTASAYPQCFIMTTEEKRIAQEKIRKEFLLKAENYVNLFKPKFFMPFAGRYTLAGKLTPLNEFKGVTEVEDAYDYFTTSTNIDQRKHKCIILNSKNSFDTKFPDNLPSYKRINKNERNDYLKNTLSKIKLDYEYEKEPTDDELLSLIPKCYERFKVKCNELRYSSDTSILIEFSKNKFIAFTCDGKGWRIISNNEIRELKKYVKMSLDKRLLKWLLMGPRYALWNVAENGSHIIFERKPNVYERALYYCMSFFYA